ncbi:hypothetical protein [Enterococcus sp. AZ126]|uniref:hypothetical protein n=1 Tax=Enterococcus sp. AZ126 TaxID=2774635 RepID=UPI003F21532A
MGLFERLFSKEKIEVKMDKPKCSPATGEHEWQEMVGYVPAEKSEYQTISLIATAIAAGDQPESKFVVRRISKRNPEVQLISVITTSIASANRPESQFVIQSIKEKKLI